MDGILVINKPRGWTSHDVVGHVRRLTRGTVRRVGHAGTLDPMATGVLVVCLGRATRLSEYLITSDKVYRAVVRLGIETDTFDAAGQVVAVRPVDVDEGKLGDVLQQFVGEIDQIPPMYSALKREGRPLYKLARQGMEVERAPRRVTIHEIVLRAWQSPDATLDVRCSAGTYIRSLAHDMGTALGCGAHVAALTRLASGPFTIDDAVAPEDLKEPADLQGRLRPLDAGLQSLPAITLDIDAARRIAVGRAIMLPRMEIPADSPCRAYDIHGKLIALIAYDAAAQVWRPKKVLMSESEN